MSFWTEPTVRWRTDIDSPLQYERLVRDGELLDQWPAERFEDSPTDCFRLGPEFWIWQPGVGGISFLAEEPGFVAFPATGVDRSWFERLVIQSWLPAVYQVWGRQVLHASAAAWQATGDVVACVGPSGAGKSTIAYGLGQRHGWHHVCDDTLAFSCTETGITLHPLPNEARLRPATAAYYGRAGRAPEPVSWPTTPLTLKRLYFLFGDESLPRTTAITRLKAAESYPLLLEQAHALTLKIPTHNQQLMRDYLEVAAAVPAFRLAYRKSFNVFEDILDTLDAHAKGHPDGRRD